MSDDIEFVVKNPSRPAEDAFKLRVPASGTVRDVKLKLQESYPGTPHPSTITVRRQLHRLQAGKVLGQLHLAGNHGSAGAVPPFPLRMMLPAPAYHSTLLLFLLLLQAIYAGRVLKDENAVLSDFVVPVSAAAGT